MRPNAGRSGGRRTMGDGEDDREERPSWAFALVRAAWFAALLAATARLAATGCGAAEAAGAIPEGAGARVMGELGR
jgi:hypothetical protein